MDRPSCSAALERDGIVAVLTMSRASRSNAIDAGMWKDLRACISFIARASPRAVVVCGRGKNFCAGIDVSDPKTMFSTLGDVEASCEGRRREALARHIRSLQDVFTALETEIEAPVIACVRGACYGAGVDLITACTIRLCGRDARFCVKEVDVGITADVGTLQRLPSIVGFGSANELALTARGIDAEEQIVQQTTEDDHIRRENLGDVEITQGAEQHIRLVLAFLRTEERTGDDQHGLDRTETPIVMHLLGQQGTEE